MVVNMENDSGRITGGVDEDPLHATCPDAEKGSMMGLMMVVLRKGRGGGGHEDKYKGKEEGERQTCITRGKHVLGQLTYDMLKMAIV
jgi:hypothetical protein